MYLLGNPAVLWSVIGWMGAAVFICFTYLRYATTPWLASVGMAQLKPYVAQMTFCFVVFLLNLAPYLGVKRSTFIYHYMPALVYAELVAARTLEALLPRRWVPLAAKAYLLLVGAVFLFYVPWIYALPLNSEGHARRRWLPRWN
jgi:dolichyl-phosphate-mannose--protein O-mannosyl transferase